jgi:D-methionine transport system substrate-binding protein
VSQVDLAFVFANYALGGRHRYQQRADRRKARTCTEYLVARPDNIQDPRIQKLAKALNSRKCATSS